MPCYHPVKVTVKRKAILPGGIRVFDKQTVPCGTCLGCRAEQARQWSVRIMHERAMHESSWFLTLTYNEDEIPEFGSLRPPHLAAFFKAIRRDGAQGPISYYACGEYGDRTQRPHYHAALFGCDFIDRDHLRNAGGHPVWRSDDLEDYWGRGNCEFGTLTHASAAYIAGYVRKKVSKKVNPDNYLRVDPDTGELVQLEGEFARMSLRPAIGRRWIEKYWRDVYPRDFVVVEGHEMKPPRYYDKWMEREQPHMFLDVLEKRHEEQEDMPPDKLKAREKIHHSRVELFQGRGQV